MFYSRLHLLKGTSNFNDPVPLSYGISLEAKTMTVVPVLPSKIFYNSVPMH